MIAVGVFPLKKNFEKKGPCFCNLTRKWRAAFFFSSDFLVWCCVWCVMRPVCCCPESWRPSLSRSVSHRRVRKEEEEHQWWPRRGRFEVGRDLWATAAIADSLRHARTRRSRGLATGPRTLAATTGRRPFLLPLSSSSLLFRRLLPFFFFSSVNSPVTFFLIYISR